MTHLPQRYYSSGAISQFSGALLSLLLLTIPTTALAHAGHGDEFQGGGQTTAPDAIQVDGDTAQRIELKVDPVKRQPLAFGIQTTGEIEALPSRRVEVTNPVGGTVVRLFVQPGDRVEAGQPLAVLTSPDLVALRTEALDRQTEAQGDVQTAQAELQLAQQNYNQQQQIAAAEIQQTETALKFAQEQYDRDQELAQQGAIPNRQVLESETQWAQARAELTQARSRLQVSEAAAQLKRAQSQIQVAQSRVQLSSATYGTRLKQLGATPNDDGTITVVAPIAGTIADREVTLGQSAQDAGAVLMTIVDGRSVLATANIYEKDIDQVAIGQRVRVRVASLPNQFFEGRITVMGSVVDGETRVVPVKAELDNPGDLLKPGMFAELEVLTDRTPVAVLAITQAAVVEANGKQLVYVQNGSTYQPVEVELGRTAGDLVEVKNGLFDGDLIVTQRASQLYAQSLRGGSSKADDAHAETPATTEASLADGVPPWWIILPVSGALAVGTFWAGTRWAGRQKQQQFVPVLAEVSYSENGYSNGSVPVNGSYISNGSNGLNGSNGNHGANEHRQLRKSSGTSNGTGEHASESGVSADLNIPPHQSH